MTRQLTHDAATVCNLAEHFEALKQRAAELRTTLRARERGFFSPTEDEQTRHLLVSYWQSRNALIELVTSLHRRNNVSAEQQPMALAVAFAGALVLIDGARFLRENCHDSPVIRAKLNEAEPNFGIPAGTYDHVQKSLTNPLHAWHLYHALREMERIEGELQRVAGDCGQFRRVLDIIGNLQHRLSISLEEFVVARTRVRARSMRTRMTRDVLRRGLYGLQKYVSSLMSEKYLRLGHQPQLPQEAYEGLQSQLLPGDVIVTRKEFALTNYFLPGYWPHVALYVGTTAQLQTLGLDQHANVQSRWPDLVTLDETPHRVLEALKDGVRVRSLASPFNSDAITVIRPRLSPSEIQHAIGRGFFHVDKPYDFDFDFTRSDRMVCTEVVYRSYEGIGDLQFQLTRRAGRLTLSAEDLMRKALAEDGFDVSCVYCPTVLPTICVGSDAVKVVQSTLAGPAQLS